MISSIYTNKEMANQLLRRRKRLFSMNYGKEITQRRPKK